MFCSYVDGDPYQTVTATLIRLFLNISIRFYALGIFDSQLSMDLCPFHFFRRKTRTIGRCLCLVQTFNGAARHERITTEPHSQHVWRTTELQHDQSLCCCSYNENIAIFSPLSVETFRGYYLHFEIRTVYSCVGSQFVRTLAAISAPITGTSENTNTSLMW